MACRRYRPMVNEDELQDPDLFTQRKKVKSVTGVLLGFAIVGLTLSAVIFSLNMAVKHVRVYSGDVEQKPQAASNGYIYADGMWHDSPTQQPVYEIYGGKTMITYYSGLWLGFLEFVLCLATVIFCVKTIKKSVRGQNAIASTGVSVSGSILSVLFGVMTLVALAGAGCSGVTFGFLMGMNYGGNCHDSGNSGEPGCMCTWQNVYIKHASSCDFAQNTLSNIYIVISVMSFFLFICNIIMSSLFCGVLCCCIPTYFPKQTNTMASLVQVPEVASRTMSTSATTSVPMAVPATKPNAGVIVVVTEEGGADRQGSPPPAYI